MSLDTGAVSLISSTIWLFATGHWIGGSISLAIYILAGLMAGLGVFEK